MSYTKNWNSLSDAAILRELGQNIKQMRLNKNITQQELATKSGLDRVTISKLENGHIATTLTLIQVLRILDRFDLLDGFKEEPLVSPLQVAEMSGKYRKRASSQKSEHDTTASEW